MNGESIDKAMNIFHMMYFKDRTAQAGYAMKVHQSQNTTTERKIQRSVFGIAVGGIGPTNLAYLASCC